MNKDEIRKIIVTGNENTYEFTIPESIHLVIPKDLSNKDRNLQLYLLLSLLGYKPEVKVGVKE